MRTRTDLMFDLFVDWEVDQVVKTSVKKPVRLSYYRDGWHTHVPDAYQLWWTGFEAFVEVKWEADASLRENEERFKVIGPAVARIGVAYIVLTERHIRRLPRFANIKMLLGIAMRRLGALLSPV